MEENKRQRLDADPQNVITCCPKCPEHWPPRDSDKLQALSVGDKPGHAHCDMCGEYPVSDIWATIETRHKAA